VLGGEPVSAAAAVLTATGVSRVYGRHGSPRAGVTGVSLTVGRGEIVGIRGPSGAGKSTLLRLLAGVERPDEGEIRYGEEPAWPPATFLRRRRFAAYPRHGYVMPVYQDPFASLDQRWPIWRIITEPLVAADVPYTRSEQRDRARRLLKRSGMAHVSEDARPGELSGGQCQRVAILRAIAAAPEVIVADEPTARQDVITAAAMTDQLRQAAEAGTAIVAVSHNTNWLETFAHRVLALHDGRLASPAPRDVT
jgi:peptide/nickel transport system ATP-binding protein